MAILKNGFNDKNGFKDQKIEEFRFENLEKANFTFASENNAKQMNGLPPRHFPLGDVISVYHGVMASPQGTNGIAKLLEYLTGACLMSADLPYASEYCKGSLRAQFPAIDKIDTNVLEAVCKRMEKRGKRYEAFAVWLNNQVLAYGAEVPLRPMKPEELKDFKPSVRLPSFSHYA